MFNEISENDKLLTFLSKFIKKYTNYKSNANLSKNTLYNTKLVLEKFYDYIAEEYDENSKLSLKDINRYFINNYLNKLSKNKISKNTQKTYLVIIKNFLIFIADEDIEKYGFIKENIHKLNIKTELKEKNSFTQNEQKRIINYLTLLDSNNSYLSHRNSLIIKLLLFTGMRISELINLKWSDINEYEDKNHGLIYTILLKGKGNKERLSYISYAQINNNLTFIKAKNKNDFIFTSTHGQQCNRSMIYLVIKNILQKAGVSKFGLHIFRHTFAKNLVSKNINLSTIKDLLGHNNITITAQFYAKSDANSMKNALFDF